MSEQDNEISKDTDAADPGGTEITNVTFDENGQVVGLEEEILDDVSGGLLESANNSGCNNSANGWC